MKTCTKSEYYNTNNNKNKVEQSLHDEISNNCKVGFIDDNKCRPLIICCSRLNPSDIEIEVKTFSQI